MTSSLNSNVSNKVIPQSFIPRDSTNSLKGFDYIYSSVYSVISQVWVSFQKLYDYIVPVNPLTAKRQFHILPLNFEFCIGSIYFFLSDTQVCSKNNELSQQHKVKNIFDKIAKEAPSYTGYEWPFELRVCPKESKNAYCLPGGKIVFFTGLVEAIEKNLPKIKQIDLEVEEGKTATIDTSDVTAEDVIAAVIGHEITHAVARHSSCVVLLASALKTALFAIPKLLELVANNYFQIRQELPKEQQKKEAPSYTIPGKLCLLAAKLIDNKMVKNLISYFTEHSFSRSNEYEADYFGMKLAEKAGFNPKGALVLQQILGDLEAHKKPHFLKNYFEALFSHPLPHNRLLANYHTYLEIENLAQHKSEGSKTKIDTINPLGFASWNQDKAAVASALQANEQKT